MQGTKENPGITSRSIDEIFNCISSIKINNLVNVLCYMVEIYQDNLIDLLTLKDNNKKLEIKEGLNGTNYIQNVTVIFYI